MDMSLCLLRPRMAWRTSGRGARPPDGVVIGGGVVGNPQMRFFMEQIIDVIRTSAPGSKILLIGRPEEAPAAVARWFPKT